MKLTKKASFKLARRVAELSSHHITRVGAVITDKHKKLLSIGINSKGSHPLAFKYSRGLKKTLCAELDALRRCHGVPHHIFVVRVKRDGTLGLAKPCPTCTAALKAANINKVYWSEYVEKI